jgi:hypothetical protein
MVCSVVVVVNSEVVGSITTVWQVRREKNAALKICLNREQGDQMSFLKESTKI